MIIHSILKETNSAIYQIELEEKYNPTSLLDEKTFTLDLEDYGSVKNNIIQTSGLCIIDVKLHLIKRVNDLFTIKGNHILLSFFFKGNSKIVEENHQSFLMDRGVVRINYQNESDFTFQMTPDENIRYLAIILSEDYFKNLLKDEPWTHDNSFFMDIQNGKFINLNENQTMINPYTFNILSQIIDQTSVGTQIKYRKPFIDLKLREILLLMHLQQEHAAQKKHTLDQKTILILQKAKSIIATNFTNPPTIKKLSREVSINEQKLKQGFKALFDDTIHGYIIKLRMAEAVKLITTKKETISQISAVLGYKSTSHFIVAFKKYYGYTPKQVSIQPYLILGTSREVI